LGNNDKRIEADLFGFIRLPGARKRMERLESSPLCFIETQSGED
jgi:hypothetical protein